MSANLLYSLATAALVKEAYGPGALPDIGALSPTNAFMGAHAQGGAQFSPMLALQNLMAPGQAPVSQGPDSMAGLEGLLAQGPKAGPIPMANPAGPAAPGVGPVLAASGNPALAQAPVPGAGMANAQTGLGGLGSILAATGHPALAAGAIGSAGVLGLMRALQGMRGAKPAPQQTPAAA